MKVLIRDSVVRCGHDGLVRNVASQSFVTVRGVAVLVAEDPVGRAVVACPNYGLNVKPCTRTLAVRTGFSTLVTVAGRAVALDVLEGLTDGVDAQPVTYTVRDPRQELVDAAT